MNILFIAKPLSKKGNGVVSALKSELKYLQEYANVALFNIGVKLDKDIAKTMYEGDKYQTITSLPEPFNRPDLIVFEEVYKLEYIKLYNECLKNKIPYIIIPHGCLVEVEQNNKKLKHMAANILLFNRFIRKAEAVEFLNEHEKENSKFKYREAIIIPNAIDIEKRKYKKDKNSFKFIYVGRYDVKVKGLDLLIKTFIDLKDWCIQNNVILELYGPKVINPEFEYLKNDIKEAKCQKIIKINGPVYGDNKSKALQEASVFIQTSRNEGQPMGIIEALSFGLPCVCTYQTSFGKYCNENECGIGVNFDKEELKSAIKKIYDDKEYMKLCEKNSLKKSKEDFDLKKVTENTLKIYKEIIK